MVFWGKIVLIFVVYVRKVYRYLSTDVHSSVSYLHSTLAIFLQRMYDSWKFKQCTTTDLWNGYSIIFVSLFKIVYVLISETDCR